MNNNNNENENENFAFKVFIRIRPYNEKEKNTQATSNKKQKNMLQVEDNLLFVLDPDSQELYGKREKSFVFDGIYTENDQNITIFEKVIKNMVGNIIQGYNSTAMAYGVTGTGKTHTMFGDIYNVNTKEKGVCIYAIDHLFETINNEVKKSFQVKVSYLEIYNEQVIDLLNVNSEALMIVEDPSKGIVVPDLMEYNVTDSNEVIKLIIEGNQRRTMAPTGQNQFSSRSHAIIQIMVEQKSKVRDTKEEVIYSKFLLVDLAGCERGGLEKGIRSQEGANINKSLLALGTCINILSDKTKKGCFVPYRDSKLTRLLKDSLGGNIMTGMISCVSPSYLTYDDTMNTLKYSSRARTIQKKITKNVNQVDAHISQYKDIIDSLKNEIGQLKEIINTQNLIITNKNNEKVLEYEIKKNEQEMSLNPKDFEGDNKENKLENSVKSKNSKANANQPMVDVEYYKEFLNSDLKINVDSNYEELEKKVENLQSNKIYLEEQIEKGANDKVIAEKYMLIKSCYEKYLEIINDKLVENIEQNMILKFNMKEIVELNETNLTHIDLIKNQIENLEKLKAEKTDDVEETDSEIQKLRDEINNINSTIQENNIIKEKISISLDKNIKFKKVLKKILIRLISNSQKEITDLHQAYKMMEKEKKDLIEKNKKFQDYLETLIKEKEKKDQKFSEVQKELIIMKKLLYEKDKKLNEYESMKKYQTSGGTNNIHSKSLSRPLKKKDGESIHSASPIHDTKGLNTNIITENNQGNQRINANIYINNNINTINNIHKIGDSNKSVKSMQNNKILNKLPTTKSKNSIFKVNNTESVPSKSPRHNKFKDYDKIIENQLNEVYAKKAKEIGDRMRKNMFNKATKINNYSSNVNNNIPKMVKDKETTYKVFSNNVIENPDKKLIKQTSKLNCGVGVNLNHSLSISNVTIQNEVCFNSEVDIFENPQGRDLTEEKKAVGKSQQISGSKHLQASSESKYQQLHLTDLVSECGFSIKDSPGKTQQNVNNMNNQKYNTLEGNRINNLHKMYINNRGYNVLIDDTNENNNEEYKRQTPNILNRNIEKFLNKKDPNTQSRKYLTANNSMNNCISINNNPVRTDNSAVYSQKGLQQARVERQLKNKENRIQNTNVSKNSELFLQEYLTAKKIRTEGGEIEKPLDNIVDKFESNNPVPNEQDKFKVTGSVIDENFNIINNNELNFFSERLKESDTKFFDEKPVDETININPLPFSEINKGITFQNNKDIPALNQNQEEQFIVNDVVTEGNQEDKHQPNLDETKQETNKLLLPDDLLKNYKSQKASKYLK